MYIDTMRRFMAAVEAQESREVKSKAEGLHQGETQALIKLLGKRFGAIPADLLETIEHADLTQISAWFDLAIDATSLQQVFGGA